MIEKLKTMKKNSQMTNQQIAEKSGVPESTVARIFSGKTPNPTIVTVISIVRAMGGTVDDLFDDTIQMNLEHRLPEEPHIIEKTPPAAPDSSPGDTVAKDFFDRYCAELVAMYQTEIRKKDLWVKRLFWTCLFFTFRIFTILLIDALNPTIGFFRY